jgi:hypothetical protein
VPTTEATDSRLAQVISVIRHDPSRWWLLASLLPWVWFVIRDVHPYLEYVAIGLPVLVGAATLVALHFVFAKRSLSRFALVLSLVIFFVVSVVLPMRPTDRPDPIDPFRVASINVGGVWYSNNDVGYLDTRQSPEILVGSELAQSHDSELRERFDYAISEIVPLSRTQANRDGLGPQSDDYRKFGFPSIGIYSDFPLAQLPDPIADSIPGGLPGIRTSVTTRSGEVVLYALHVPRPGSGDGVYELSVTDQSRMIDAIVDAIAAESLPVIVIGDLNVVDRSNGYRDLTGVLVDGMREERWARPTRSHALLHSLLLARIDHVLVSEALCVSGAQTERLLFTDHTPIYADIGLCETS